MTLPHLLVEHRNAQDAFDFRIRTIQKLMNFYKSDCDVRMLALNITEKVPEVKRQYYDLVMAKAVYDWMYQFMRFRKDVHEVETIQVPLVTLKTMAGDCDDFVVFSGSVLLSLGIPVNIVISQQNGPGFDHIALYLPTVGAVFDRTYPGGFPAPVSVLRNFKILGV